MKTVINSILRGPNVVGTIIDRFESDWVVFRNRRFKDSEASWVPSDYYVDILFSLLLRMREDQKIDFLKKEIDLCYEERFPKNSKHSRTLAYLLNWPYQVYFMKTAELMWEFLPENSYADLLEMICDNIELNKRALWYGEEKTFDYRKLLKEFWNQSPEHYKSYVLRDNELTYSNGEKETLNVGKKLLVQLFSLKNFTYEDRKNIELILASATGKERENILFSEEWENICFRLMEEEKWETLNWFVLSCSLPKEEEDKFKRKLSFTEEAKSICIDFMKNDKLNAADSFIKWSSLSEEEINKLKEEMICSEDGRDACVELISPDKKVKAVDQFIRWFLPSEKDVNAFKEKLVFSSEGTYKCVGLVRRNQLELVNEFINLGLSSEEQIKELKKTVAYKWGHSVCERLISDYLIEDIYDKQGYYTIGSKTVFNGGKWEEVDKFLSWCFSSKEEISEFKKELLKVLGQKIHFNLIRANQLGEAKKFFAWIGLSDEEIKQLKKETLFNCVEAHEMFYQLIYSRDDYKEFSDYGSKREAIELLLGWYLADKEAICEFKNQFKHLYEYKTEENKAVLSDLDRIIKHLLSNFDEEKMVVKRKSETSSPSKRFCN